MIIILGCYKDSAMSVSALHIYKQQTVKPDDKACDRITVKVNWANGRSMPQLSKEVTT